MKYLWWTLGIVSTAVVTRELWLAFVTRRARRRTVFSLAQQRAQQLGKPLIVVGNPAGGIIMQFFGPDYTCGSICVDATGCPGCETQVVGRLEDVLPHMDANSAVVFVSNALEFVDDIVFVANQLDRISGGNLFITHTESASLTGWFWPGAKRRILFAPPESPDLIYKTLPWHPEPQSAPLYVISLPNVRQRLVGVLPQPVVPPPGVSSVIDTDGFEVD